MAEYVSDIGVVFGALTDNTRRDILQRVSRYQLTVSQLAEPYTLSFKTISKHLKVLEQAGLIIKRRVGRKHYVSLAPGALKDAAEYLDYYTHFWESNLDSLKNYLERSEDG